MEKPKPETNTVPPILTELLAEQAKGALCREVAAIMGRSGSCYSHGCHGILVRTTPLDGMVQTLVPNSIRPSFLYLDHYLKITGNLAEHRMHNTMGRELHWLEMANDIYKTFIHCRTAPETASVSERKAT